MFSLGFADTLHTWSMGPDERAQANADAAASASATFEAIGAALQLYDLCHPKQDSTIDSAALEKVLRTHLGNEEDVKRVLGLLREGDSEDGASLNFLGYWQGMDRFFDEAGGGFLRRRAATDEKYDTVQGMQKFRDGVLALHRAAPTNASIPSVQLVSLLQEIHDRAEDPPYWQEVMQAVPQEEGFGLSLTEVAEAVFIWMKDFAQGGNESGAGSPQLGGHLDEDARSSSSSGSSSSGSGSTSSSSQTPMKELSPTALTRRRGALFTRNRDSLLDGSTSNVQRVTELMDLIQQRTPAENAVVREAVAKLATVHEAIFTSMSTQQMELSALQQKLAGLTEKKASAEEELLNSSKHLNELDRSFGEVERQRDEAVKNALGMEGQLRELTERCTHLESELARTQAEQDGCQQERTQEKRRTIMWQGRLAQLEKEADSAEGRVSWLSNELATVKRLLTASRSTCRSYACLAEESDEVAAMLQQHVARGPLHGAPVGDSGPEQDARCKDLSKQLEVQQAQLQRLRQVRDDLVKNHHGLEGAEQDDDSRSPRALQAQRRCGFLAAQLQALLRHTQDVEDALLDEERHAGGAGGLQARRELSIRQVAEDSKKAFSDLAEKLHTLEVQKADADHELRRLQARLAEQEAMTSSMKGGDDTATRGSVQGGGDDHSDTASSSFASGRGLHSDGGFLFGTSSRLGVGQLRVSPKSIEHLRQDAKKVIQISRATAGMAAGAAAAARRRASRESADGLKAGAPDDDAEQPGSGVTSGFRMSVGSTQRASLALGPAGAGGGAAQHWAREPRAQPALAASATQRRDSSSRGAQKLRDEKALRRERRDRGSDRGGGDGGRRDKGKHHDAAAAGGERRPHRSSVEAEEGGNCDMQ